MQPSTGYDNVLEAATGCHNVLEATSGCDSVLEATSRCDTIVEATSECHNVLEATSGCDSILEATSGCDTIVEATSRCDNALEATTRCDNVLEATSGHDNTLEGTGNCHNISKEITPQVVMEFKDESEWPALGCACMLQDKKLQVGANGQPQKLEEKKKSKTKRAKTWKPVSQMELGFSYAVLAHMQYGLDESMEDEMDQELQQFEKLLTNPKDESGIELENEKKPEANLEKPEEQAPDLESKPENVQERVADENIKAKTKEEKGLEMTVANKKIQNANKRKRRLKGTAVELHEEDQAFDYERDCMLNKVPSKMGYVLDFEGLYSNQFRLRRARKWRKLKTRKAVKCKQCKDFGIMAHGQHIYISTHMHWKLDKLREFSVPVHHHLPGPKFHQGYQHMKERMNPAAYAPRPAAVHAGRNHPANRKNYPVAQPRPRHALNAGNADAEIPADILNVLMALQDRDLTPEDYEILLRLDERVKPKTLEEEILESFRTDDVTLEVAQNATEPCAVCLEPYQEGQMCKFLPCGHYFHGNCIDMWLKNSSMNCPLDGLPVDEQ